MKKKILMFFSLIFVILLAACDGLGGTVDVKLEIKGVNGVTDADINLEEKTIKFNVSSETDSFDVSNILVPSDVTVIAFQDGEHTISLGRIVSLEDGINVYYLLLTASKATDNWTMYITKLSNDAKSPVSLSVKNLDQTYSLNESFKGGVITVTYNDNTFEDIVITSDMITGFDTSSLGQKRLTISYKGLVVIFDYLVTSEIKAIEVVSGWTKDYLVNTTNIYEGGILKVILADDTTQEISITQDMVSGFDTTTPGNKELTITYKNKVAIVEYSVHSQYTSVTIANLKTKYRYGQELAGDLVFTLGDYQFRKPLKDYATGYDAFAYGKQQIFVNEYGLTATVEVVEKNVNTEFVEPSKTDLSVEDFKAVYAIIGAISDTGYFEGEEFDEAYDEYFNDDSNYSEIENVLEVLEEAGITKEQIDQVVELYKSEAAPLLNKFANDINNESYQTGRDMLYSITEEDIAKAQFILSELLYILEPNQVTVLASKIIVPAGANSSRHFNFINIDKVCEYLGKEELKDLLRNSNLEIVANFIESLETISFDTLITTDDYYFMVQMAYTLIDAVTKVSAADINELLHYVLDLTNGDVEINNVELVSKLHKAANILEEVLIETNLVADFEELIVERLAKVIINEDYYTYMLNSRAVKLVCTYAEDIISIVKNITEDDIETIIDFIDVIYSENEEELTNMDIAIYAIKIAKIIEPILTSVNANTQEKTELAFLFTNLVSDDDFYRFLSKAVYWTSLNPNKLTNEQADDITDSLTTLFSDETYLNVSGEYDNIIVPVGSKTSEILRILAQYIEVSYRDGETGNYTTIPLTLNTVKGLDASVKGWHSYTVSQDGMSVELFYYVCDPKTEGSLSSVGNSLGDYILYFDINCDKPYEFALNKEYLRWYINDKNSWFDYTQVSELISWISYEVALENSGVEAYFNIPFDAEIEYVVDTTSTGLKLGYLKYTTLYGDILVPFQYYVYDSNNPTYEVDNVINLAQGEYYDNRHMVLYDFGRQIMEVYIYVDGEETQELGTFTKEFNGIEFTINVLDERELNKIAKMRAINLTVDATDPSGTVGVGNSNVSFSRKRYFDSYDWYSYNEFINYLNKYYNNPSIVFEWDTYENLYNYVQVPYTIYEDGEVLFEGFANVELIPNEQFYSYNIHLQQTHYNQYMFVNDYESLNVNDVLKYFTVEKRYNYIPQAETISYEEFINLYDIELVNSYEDKYYRVYDLIYTSKETGLSDQRNVCVALTENMNVITYLRLYCNDLTFIGIPTEQQIIDEIARKVYFRVEKLSGHSDYIYNEEAQELFATLEPRYEVFIYSEGFEVNIYYTYEGEERHSFVRGNFYTIDENSTIISNQNRPIVITELTKEFILKQLIECLDYNVEIHDIYGNWFHMSTEEYVSKLELVTDLSSIQYGNNNVVFSFYGAMVSYDINYINIDNYTGDYYFGIYTDTILVSGSEEEIRQACLENVNIWLPEYDYRLPFNSNNNIMSQYNVTFDISRYNFDGVYNVMIQFQNDQRYETVSFVAYEESAGDYISGLDFWFRDSRWINLKYETESGLYQLSAYGIIVNSYDNPFEQIVNIMDNFNYRTLNGDYRNAYGYEEIVSIMNEIGYTFDLISEEKHIYQLMFNNVYRNVYYIALMDYTSLDLPVSLNICMNGDDKGIYIDNSYERAYLVNVTDVNNVQLSELMISAYEFNYETFNNYYYNSYDNNEIINELERIGYKITYMNDVMNGLVRVIFNDIYSTTMYFIVYDESSNLYSNVSLTIRNSTVEVFYEQQGFNVSAYIIENGDIYTGILESIYRMTSTTIFGDRQTVRNYDDIKMTVENIGYSITLISDGEYEAYRLEFNDLNKTEYFFAYKK